MNRRLTDAEIDEALSAKGEKVQPPFSFVDSVMVAVQREAAEPPPISFPWRRAVPGVAAAALIAWLMIASLIAAFRSALAASTVNSDVRIALAPVAHLTGAADILWTVFAILVSLICVSFSRRVGA